MCPSISVWHEFSAITRLAVSSFAVSFSIHTLSPSEPHFFSVAFPQFWTQPAMAGMLLTNTPHCTNYISESAAGNTRETAFFQLRMRSSKRWGGISGMWDPLEQHEWLYNRKSKETAHYWFEFELTVWCVQLGFGLLRAIFHGVQRVRAWYHIFDALVALFHKTGTIKMAQTMHYVTSCLIRKLLVLLLSATLPLPN